MAYMGKEAKKRVDMCITIHFSVHLKLTQHGDQLYFNNFLKK